MKYIKMNYCNLRDYLEGYNSKMGIGIYIFTVCLFAEILGLVITTIIRMWP